MLLYAFNMVGMMFLQPLQTWLYSQYISSIAHCSLKCFFFSVADQQWHSHCGRSSQLDSKRCHGWGCWSHHHKAERMWTAPSLLLQTQTCIVEICRHRTNWPGRKEAAAGTTAMAERLRLSLQGLLWAGDMRLQPGWHQVPSKDTIHLYVKLACWSW